MGDDLEKHTGRTWADLVFALPRYMVVVLLVVIFGLILRAEFSVGVTKYGFLGEWGREPLGPPSADDAIIGANIRMNRQLKCAELTMKDLPSDNEEWKNYVQVTAETVNNSALRQSRTATWQAEVDDVLQQIETAMQYVSGDRSSC